MKWYYMVVIIFFAVTIVSAGPYSSSINQGPYSSNINKISGDIIYNTTNIFQNITINVTDLYLNNLTDVQVPSPSDGESLVWDSGIMKWISETVISRWIVGTTNGFLYNDSDTIYFNDTLLNDTILDIVNNEDNIFTMYFTSSMSSVVVWNFSKSDQSIVTVKLEPGEQYIFGDSVT